MHSRRRSLRLTASGLLLCLGFGLVSVLGPLSTPATAAAATPVMGRSVVSASDLAGWFRSTGKVSRATVSIDGLARYYVEEGAAEGVTGDVAFAQSIVETGYFAFSARVPPELNNFSGLGAVDGGNTAEAFPDARTGVRAQIQHLRAYADPTVTEDRLAHPLVDTRFHLVKVKGKAPTWEQFGAGVWASDPDYAGKVMRIRQQIMQWGRRYGTARFAPFAGPGPFARQAFRDVLFREGTAGEIALWETALKTSAVTPEVMVAELFGGEGASTVQPVTRLYLATLGRAPDRGGLVYWTGRRKAGAPLASLAAQVMGSREFQERFGAPTDGAFVDLLYRNVLGREADEAGQRYWVGRLNSGSISRTGVVLWFSESPENKAGTSAMVEATVLHLGLFLSLPTADEIADWKASRASGEGLDDAALALLIDQRYFARF